MAKANQYFIKRGEKDVIINYNSEKLAIKIYIPTNKEHDELMEKFTELTPEGTGDIRMAEFVEEQMITFIVDLPFEVPIDKEMTKFANWKNTNQEERKIAVSLMDPTLRDIITNNINSMSKLSNNEVGN